MHERLLLDYRPLSAAEPVHPTPPDLPPQAAAEPLAAPLPRPEPPERPLAQKPAQEPPQPLQQPPDAPDAPKPLPKHHKPTEPLLGIKESTRVQPEDRAAAEALRGWRLLDIIQHCADHRHMRENLRRACAAERDAKARADGIQENNEWLLVENERLEDELAAAKAKVRLLEKKLAKQGAGETTTAVARSGANSPSPAGLGGGAASAAAQQPAATRLRSAEKPVMFSRQRARRGGGMAAVPMTPITTTAKNASGSLLDVIERATAAKAAATTPKPKPERSRNLFGDN